MTMICCENCRYFHRNVREEPCLSCSFTQDRIEYWEPIIEEVYDGEET